jgi:hypothetical protein
MPLSLIDSLADLLFPPQTPRLELGSWVDSLPLLPSKVVLSPEFVSTHKHIIGLTGMGKSKVLESIFLQLFNQGVGVSFIDPHGTSANAILKTLIAEGFFDKDGWDRRLLYIEFTEDGPYLPFNVLNQPTFRPHTIGQHVKKAFHRCWPSFADGVASRFDNLLLASINVLIDNHLPLPAVHLLLTRPDFRDRLLANTKDPFIVSFFKDRMEEWSKREAPQMRESTLSKIFMIAHQPVLRFSLGQRDNALNFRSILDSGTSVIFNIARIQDDDTQKLLACLLTLGYERATLSRGDHEDPESIDWKEHHLILDDFQNYTANSEDAMATFLDKTRKFELFLTLAHQTWDQASMRIQGALQNVGVRIGLRLGHNDANYFTSVFGKVDPKRVKEEETSGLSLLPGEEKHGLKAFLELQGQWREWTQTLLDLPKRQALVKLSGKPTVHINTLNVPSYNVDSERLKDIKRRYRDRLMSTPESEAQANQHFSGQATTLTEPKPVTPVAYTQAYELTSG